jgi:hypothetical protein
MPNDGRELSPHVREYFESRDVDVSKLPENVLETFAGLSTREVELLAFIGAELERGGLDNAIVARIH